MLRGHASASLDFLIDTNLFPGQFIELIYKIRYRLKPESHKIGTKLEISEIVQKLLFIIKSLAKACLKLLNSSSYMGLKFSELLRLLVGDVPRPPGKLRPLFP